MTEVTFQWLIFNRNVVNQWSFISDIKRNLFNRLWSIKTETEISQTNSRMLIAWYLLYWSRLIFSAGLFCSESVFCDHFRWFDSIDAVLMHINNRMVIRMASNQWSRCGENGRVKQWKWNIRPIQEASNPTQCSFNSKLFRTLKWIAHFSFVFKIKSTVSSDSRWMKVEKKCLTTWITSQFCYCRSERLMEFRWWKRESVWSFSAWF